jgi:hypothetical protein
MMGKRKITPKPESVVIHIAERLYKMAEEQPDLQELRTLAGKLETSNSHLLEDIYEQCCIAIEPFVHAGILPGSVVESIQMLVEDLQKRTAEE